MQKGALLFRGSPHAPCNLQVKERGALSSHMDTTNNAIVTLISDAVYV